MRPPTARPIPAIAIAYSPRTDTPAARAARSRVAACVAAPATTPAAISADDDRDPDHDGEAAPDGPPGPRDRGRKEQLQPPLALVGSPAADQRRRRDADDEDRLGEERQLQEPAGGQDVGIGEEPLDEVDDLRDRGQRRGRTRRPSMAMIRPNSAEGDAPDDRRRQPLAEGAAERPGQEDRERRQPDRPPVGTSRSRRTKAAIPDPEERERRRGNDGHRRPVPGAGDRAVAGRDREVRQRLERLERGDASTSSRSR